MKPQIFSFVQEKATKSVTVGPGNCCMLQYPSTESCSHLKACSFDRQNISQQATQA